MVVHLLLLKGSTIKLKKVNCGQSHKRSAIANYDPTYNITLGDFLASTITFWVIIYDYASFIR